LVENISNNFVEAEKIRLVMDNYEIFEPAKARALLERFEFVYTPKQ